jgi:UDP-GlcNAc:undecaprenyl-phosphate GlcNAc-1-phosphate transferase
MNGYQLAADALLGLIVSLGLILLVLKACQRRLFSGREEEFHHSHLHQPPVPRLGGIALAVAFISVFFLFLGIDSKSPFEAVVEVSKIAGFSLAMFALGLWDDFRSLGARRKFVGQMFIASAAYFSGIGIHVIGLPFMGTVELGFWSWPVTLFWLVGMTNLINLIDGVDGLAGGIGLMLMLLLAGVGGGAGGVQFIAVGMTGALLGFLCFNFPPARIYMGDGGAYFLGFLIGCLTIANSHKGTVFAALIAPLFVLALPILDTSLAIVRRGVRGLPLFRPDRRHIHHRLLEMGLSRRQIILALYTFTAVFLLLGLAAFWSHDEYLPVLAGCAVLIILLAAGKLSFSREWFAVGRVLGGSLEIRSEIQYALHQTRWLAMEGARCKSIESLWEDLVFVAKKLGFAKVRLELEDGEKIWQLPDVSEADCYCSRHELPGKSNNVLELCAPRSKQGREKFSQMDGTKFRILGDLVTEGWIKAAHVWEQSNQSPVRFETRETSVAAAAALQPRPAAPPAV